MIYIHVTWQNCYCFQLSCSMVIIDDIIDNGDTRRGKHCWYLNEDVGLRGLYDAILIYSTINDTLKQKFFNSHKYGAMTRSVLKTSHDLLLGHKCEVETSNSKEPILKKFTHHRYYTISKYKTTAVVNCAFEMAFNLANITDKEVLLLSRYAVDNVGYLFQVQVSR